MGGQGVGKNLILKPNQTHEFWNSEFWNCVIFLNNSPEMHVYNNISIKYTKLLQNASIYVTFCGNKY